MSNTLKFGNGQWGTKVGSALAYNDLDGNFKPLPFDFTRSTSATRINKDGLIEVVTNNKPRIDFSNDAKGALLLEPTRSNILPYSEDFSNAAWGHQNVTINSNQIIAPDGTLTADKIIDNSTNSAHRITDGNTTSSSGSFTYSIFLKKGTLTTAQIQVFNSGTASSANVDLVNGTITSDGAGVDHKIENYGNDWFKCSISGTLSNTATTVYLYLKQKPSYIGNEDYLYAWGAQLEQGSYATSYIPTQGSAVTRVADACNNGNLNVDYSGDYTLYLEHETLSLTEYNQFQFRQETSISYIFRVGNSLNIGTNLYTAANTIGFNKFALSVGSDGSYSFYKNGSLLSSGSGLNANLETIKNDALGMSIKDIKLYNTRLSNAELQALTSN